MKKTIALLLVLLTVCALSAAAAQSVEIYREDTLFYIEVALPSGARVASSTTDENLSMTELQFIAGDKPTVMITAAPDETYVGQSLSDLSKEDVEQIISGMTIEMESPTVDIHKTPEGYEYIVFNENTQANDACDTMMLVNGYFIMVQVYYEDYRELTPDDMLIGPSIAESFHFVGNTNS